MHSLLVQVCLQFVLSTRISVSQFPALYCNTQQRESISDVSSVVVIFKLALSSSFLLSSSVNHVVIIIAMMLSPENQSTFYTHLRLVWIVTWEPVNLLHLNAKLVRIITWKSINLLLPGRSFRWSGFPWSPYPTVLSDSTDSDRCTRTRSPDRSSFPPPRGTCTVTSHVNTDWCSARFVGGWGV